ncbi:unnamed protein product [Thelazia callipaeda]|uniref:Autophagy-related protein 2 n=1 Tax=Thelazia callipaeda TaxID=103827 RepID=A0A158RAU2_THECL|nr:unnamed protein product [Thelazia callipaeda]
MVGWSLSNITDALQKRLCRFLIHRYLSDFLKSSINLEQLSTTLYGGIASVSDVDIDVQRINEALEMLKIPFVAVEGYIGKINITVPWQQILVKSVDLEVKQLQLTLQLQQFGNEPLGDVVTSMFGSVIGSLATSMELAQSFLNQEDFRNEVEDKGVEQFAEVIDAVISRFRLIFEDATIRLESLSNQESGLCTALELRVDWVELVDEQLESEILNSEAITSQPRSLSSLPNFNKLFHVRGIRLYTDIFNKPEMKEEENMSSSVAPIITSMYLRREKEKTLRKLSASLNGTHEQSEKNDVLSSVHMPVSSIFESCYSHNSSVGDNFDSHISQSKSSYNDTYESNPVLCASFSSSIETVVVRMRNNAISSQSTVLSEKEINLNFDGLCVFLTPSQLKILETFFSTIFRPSVISDMHYDLGKPMTIHDYQKVEAELQSRINQADRFGTAFQHGNWGGSMLFYDAQRNLSAPSAEEEMTNVSLDFNDIANRSSSKFSKEISRNYFPPKPSKNLDSLSDVISVKASICNVVIVLTHKDYLGQYEVQDKGMENITNIINCYKDLAEGFFKTTSALRLRVHLNELRQSTKYLYENDHLLQNCVENVKLFSFCDNALTTPGSCRLMLNVESNINLKHCIITVNLASCESELDISIIDRLPSLLFIRPFHTYPFPTLIRNIDDVSRGLKTDFLFTAMKDTSSTSSSTTILILNCPEWSIHLRIPVAGLHDTNSKAFHWKRHLHKESLWLTLLCTRLEIPSFDISRFGQCGAFTLSATSFHGMKFNEFVVGSFSFGKQSESPDLDLLFLYGGCMETDGSDCVSLKISYDRRDISLETTSVPCNEGEYFYSSQYDSENETDTKLEGPFSKCIIRNESQVIVVVGSTKEMLEFGEACQSNAKVNCELNIPVIRIHLPSRHCYEIIYNRLMNDLAMWKPSSPAFNSDRPRDFEASIDDLFHLCRSTRRKNSVSSETNVSYSHRSTPTVNAWSSEKSHDFCLIANIEDGRLLIGTEFEDAAKKEVGQVGTILHKTQMMLVNGFHGNKELSYFYSTSKVANVFHKNLIGNILPYERCVLKKDFAQHCEEGIQAEPITDEEICLLEKEEDNFAIAVRIDYNFPENIKNMLVGVGIRNTMLHLQPWESVEQFWINQVIRFFNIPDYGILDCKIPQAATELHVHFSSSLLVYEHYFSNQLHPLSLRVVLSSCDINSRIMQDLEIYKFGCIFEQLKLFASFNPSVETKKSSDDRKKCPKFGLKFLHILSVGMLKLEVIAVKNLRFDDDKLKRSSPFLEIKCKNDLLKTKFAVLQLWACSDSLCTIVNAISELLDAHSSHTVRHEDYSATTSKAVWNDSEKWSPTEQQMANIEKMVQSAMLELPEDDIIVNTCTADSNETTGRRKDKDTCGMSGIDEGFCLLEEIPGNGIMAGSGRPKARVLFRGGSPPIIHDNYLKKIDERSVLSTTSKNYIPLFKYCIDDLSLELHLYGGADFKTSKPPFKPYSASSSGGKLRRENFPAGGRYRDYSVHVELRLSKVRFMFEIYDKRAPVLSTRMFSIGSAEILDKLVSSKINKLLYPHVWDRTFPRHSQSPVFSVRVYETHQHEGKMKVSLLPLRINADQDTMEFLEDFINDLSSGIALLKAESVSTSKIPENPRLEVPSLNNTDAVRWEKDVHHNTADSLNAAAVTDLFLKDRTHHGFKTSSNDMLHSDSDDDIHLEEDSDENLMVSKWPALAPKTSNQGGSTDDISDFVDPFCFLDSSISHLDQNVVADKVNNSSDQTGLSSKSEAVIFEDVHRENENMENHIPLSVEYKDENIALESIGGTEIFFKEFIFSPSAVICLDMNGKRIRPDQGWFLGLLVGLSDFKCTEIRLKELNCTRGLLGYDKCFKFAFNAWLNDINNKQLVQFITSYGPIKSLVEVGSGIRDLFLMPVNEYCREEGHVVKGLQRGAESFGISTATVAVDMLQKMVGVVQSVAELAFDIVSPEYPIYRHRRHLLDSATRRPNDIREGFNMALEAIRQEINETALDFQLAAIEDKSSGYSTVRGLLRQAPTTVLRPVIASRNGEMEMMGSFANMFHGIADKQCSIAAGKKLNDRGAGE